MAAYDRKTGQTPTERLAPSEGAPALEATYGNAFAAESMPTCGEEGDALDAWGEDLGAGGEATGVEVVLLPISALPGEGEAGHDAADAAVDWATDGKSMLVTHCYVRTTDGWSAGFTIPGDGGPIQVYSPEPRAAEAPQAVVGTLRQTDPESQAMTEEQLQASVKESASAIDPGTYDALGNNCGDFVRSVLEASHLLSVVPNLSGLAGDLQAAASPGVDAAFEATTDAMDSGLTTHEQAAMLTGADEASAGFAGA